MDTNITLPGATQIRQSSKVAGTQAVNRVRPDAGPAKQPVSEKQTEVAMVDKSGLEDAVEAINQQFQQMQRALQFTIDEDSGRTIITVMDQIEG
jgi:flagellar protein FlaG